MKKLLFLLLFPLWANGQITTAQVQDTINLKQVSPFSITKNKQTFTFLNQFAAQINALAVVAIPSTRQVIAGTGLTGGGDLSADRTFTVSYGTSSTTATVGNDSRVNNGQTAFGWGNHAGLYPPVARQVIAGTGLTGGGTFSADRTLAVDFGTSSTTATVGNDSRVNNGQTAFGWGNHSGLYVPVARQIIAGTGLGGGGALSADRTLTVTYGATASTATEGNDSRVNNGQTAFGWGNHAIAGYVSTTGNQTGLTGDKATSGLWTYTNSFVNGQVTFGSTGQGAKLNLIEGAGGTNSTTIGYGNATSSSFVISALGGLSVQSASSNGVNVNATHGSGFVNFLSANTQTARMQNGRFRIGTTTTDNTRATLTVDGAVELIPSTSTIYMKSPNGTRYAVTVSDIGVLTVTAAP